MSTAKLIMHRGSDVDFKLVWPSTAGPLDLTGYSVFAFEPSTELEDYLELEISDAEEGEITGRIEWSDSFKNGEMTFRVQIVNGTQNVSTPKIYVKVL